MTSFHIEDTKLTFHLCARSSQVHKWIKKQQNRIVVAVIADVFWISRNLSD